MSPTANRLVHEKSPYLLQHAHNPVDWHPWSDEAFAKAGAENKPIFLSIGYATCHWCHVMEKESFEDSEVAEELNKTFVCIKVDREERPDVDALYMSACHMITGSGGWPLTIFMTADKKPFFAATYLPKASRFGRAGVVDLCRRVRSLWSTNPQSLFSSAEQIAGHMQKLFEFPEKNITLDEKILATAATRIQQSFDADHGGFDRAPKFPTPHRLQFLLHQYQHHQNPKLLEMVTKTLTAMRLGGLWDHIGFGFHRYSTDEKWLLPHFEKMLYDQALLAMAYLEAYQLTRTPLFSRTAREIFEYVKRDMTAPDGGFYTAEDADSEGEEGKFYVWTLKQWQDALGEDAATWQAVFNIAPEGNYNEEATGHPTGANIAHLTRSGDQWARRLGLAENQFNQNWREIRQKLFNVRKERVPPLKDDKILTDWNGLMTAAFAMGARILGEPEFEGIAVRAAEFIRKNLTGPDGRLYHRYRGGEAAIDATANDYAYDIMGLLELYRTTSKEIYLDRAVALQTRMTEDFWNSSAGGLYLTPKHSSDLPVRPVELYDGAMPSANSVTLVNLIRLSRLTGQTRWEDMAHQMVRTFGTSVQEQPTAYTHFLTGLGDMHFGSNCEVAPVGDPNGKN